MNRQFILAVWVATFALTMGGCVRNRALHEAIGRGGALYDLKQIKSDLKKVYFDTALGGFDLEARSRETEAAIRGAQSDQERFRALSRFLQGLNDSHTRYLGYIPVTLSDFGFSYRFYGERAFVSAVDSWSKANEAGLRRGDEIVAFHGDSLTRQNEERVLVDFLGRHPISMLHLDVRAPDKTMSNIVIAADTTALRKMSGRDYRKLHRSVRDSLNKVTGHMTVTVADRVFIWRLPEFEYADIGLGHVARKANKYEVVILDLRGNSGGPVEHLKEVLAYFIAEPIDIGTLHMRWTKERFKAKPSGDRMKGKVYLLVDSETASAAEVFARLLQLHGWATIVGDKTAAEVRVSMIFGAASISVSDFVLPNGEHLERVGVEPDIRVIPTAQEIADGADPALATILGIHGIQVTPKLAGSITPIK